MARLNFSDEEGNKYFITVPNKFIIFHDEITPKITGDLKNNLPPLRNLKTNIKLADNANPKTIENNFPTSGWVIGLSAQISVSRLMLLCIKNPDGLATTLNEGQEENFRFWSWHYVESLDHLVKAALTSGVELKACTVTNSDRTILDAEKNNSRERPEGLFQGRRDDPSKSTERSHLLKNDESRSSWCCGCTIS